MAEFISNSASVPDTHANPRTYGGAVGQSRGTKSGRLANKIGHG